METQVNFVLAYNPVFSMGIAQYLPLCHLEPFLSQGFQDYEYPFRSIIFHQIAVVRLQNLFGLNYEMTSPFVKFSLQKSKGLDDSRMGREPKSEMLLPS